MKKLLITLLISTSLIGTSQALTFTNNNSGDGKVIKTYASGSGQACNSGYVKIGKLCVFKLPSNALSSLSGSGQECNSGYIKKGYRCIADSYSIEKPPIPPNAYHAKNSVDGWRCKPGYKKIGNHCIEYEGGEKSKNLVNVYDWWGEGDVPTDEEVKAAEEYLKKLAHDRKKQSQDFKKALIISIIAILLGDDPATALDTGFGVTYDKTPTYSGTCPCPYSIASDGSKCGARSAWSRTGGESPVCY